MKYRFREVRKLSKLEERMILKAIEDDELWDTDNGSSRAVLLSLGEKTVEVLKSLDINPDSVIKVSIGNGGCNQSKFERDAYETATPAQVSILADIYAYGRTIQIMERLDCSLTSFFQDLYECTDINSDDNGYDEIRSTDMHYMVKNYFMWNDDENISPEYLDDLAVQFDIYLQKIYYMTGGPGDNCQVGLDINGNIKCYDYGFFRGATHSEYCCHEYCEEVSWNLDKYVNRILDDDGSSLQDIASEF